MAKRQPLPPALLALFTQIVNEHLLIETLVPRNSDGFDFHEVSVIGIQDALKAAYDAGLNAQSTNRTEVPVYRRTVLPGVSGLRWVPCLRGLPVGVSIGYRTKAGAGGCKRNSEKSRLIRRLPGPITLRGEHIAPLNPSKDWT